MILSSACQPWHADHPGPMPESAATKPSATPLPGTRSRGRDRPWRRPLLSADDGVPELRRSHPARRRHVASLRRARAGTGGLPLWERRCPPSSAGLSHMEIRRFDLHAANPKGEQTQSGARNGTYKPGFQHRGNTSDFAVYAHMRFPCPLQGASDDATKSTRPLEPADRSFVAQKDTMAGIARAPLPQVVGDRLANVRWQRKVVALTVLATHTDLSSCPIDVTELERHPPRSIVIPIAPMRGSSHSRGIRWAYPDRCWRANELPHRSRSRGEWTKVTSWLR